MTKYKIAAIQFAATDDKAANLDLIERFTREAVGLGASTICFPELMTTPYFCWESNNQHFAYAEPISGDSVNRLQVLAKEAQVTLVASFYEKSSGEYFNSTIILADDGNIVGHYRKNSIPLSVGASGITANEKMYFSPGDLGFPVFDLGQLGRYGILICYDRHFPEAARMYGLKGADVLFVPTASWRPPVAEQWEIELRAHAIANGYYVVGVNKAGKEPGGSPHSTYFGMSLVIAPDGEVIARANGNQEEIVIAEVDPREVELRRQSWPMFRDRRPELYEGLADRSGTL